MTRVALEGSPRPEGPGVPDRACDRPRRRDGERLVRPHRHDLEGVHIDLLVGVRPHRRDRERQEARRLLLERQRDGVACTARADSQAALCRGSCTRDRRHERRLDTGQADRQGRQGDRPQRRADFRLRRRHLAAAFQPAQARGRPLGCRAGRGRHRPRHGEERAFRRRRHHPRCRERPGSGLQGRRRREVRRRRIARRRDVRGIHDPDCPEAAAHARLHLRARGGQGRRIRTSSPAGCRRCCRVPRR